MDQHQTFKTNKIIHFDTKKNYTPKILLYQILDTHPMDAT